MTKLSWLFLVSLLLPADLLAVDRPKEIPLWPGVASGSEGKTGQESVVTSDTGELRVSGIHKRTSPRRTKQPAPRCSSFRAAVTDLLAITHEGYNVAEWLSERGIAAFVLKHRLAREPNSTYQVEIHSLQDTQRAIRVIRSRAAEWGIDPARLGVMGFSAGGELAALASMRFDSGIDGAADLIDRQGSKPAFQALIYPGASGKIVPTKDSPPVFLACGYGDRPDISDGLATVYFAFKKAGVPSELHIYAGAGHGFGLRSSNRAPVASWPDRFKDWLADRGFVAKP